MSIKKLIEVALPLEAINAASSREKSIRHGHPSTLHLWWSRKPTATARAVIFASLVDDPSSHPELFPTGEAQARERQRLHDLLAQLVTWENSTNEEILEAARAEIRKYTGGEALTFLDPFAGGGSIPLEAQRLGLEAHAHDLNPVAVMINKAMLEIPPRFAGEAPVNPEARNSLGRDRSWRGAAGLAEDVRHYGQWMREEAFRRIGHLYPRVPLPAEQGGGEAIVIAWKWARTVACPNPACGCSMPLVSSFVLSKKKGKEAWVEPVIEGKEISYVVHAGKCPEGKETNKLGKGATFRCPVCGATTEKKYIYDTFKNNNNNARLVAIVAEGKRGRIYLPPDAEHEKFRMMPKPEEYPQGEMPQNPRWFSPPMFGLEAFPDLFTPRQLTALTTFSDLVREAQRMATRDALARGMEDDGRGLEEGGCGATAYGQAVGVYLAFVVDKLTDYHSSLCSWNVPRENLRNVFARQAIPMVWDYAEANPFSGSSGCFDNMLEWVFKCLPALPASAKGSACQRDAQTGYNLRHAVISTDPPYYDNIGYADLSDFFYVWLRRTLKATYPQLFRTMLVPKEEELVATPYRFGGSREKARTFFEDGMLEACRQLYAAAREDVPVTVYYAYKQSENDEGGGGAQASTGWETMLSALVEAGFAITGTWPMRTEKPGRSLEIGTNALASSVVLVCRKRPENAPSCSRRAFLAALKRELRDALHALQASNIAPVDMAQAAIGPGMGVYSRHAKVLEADGKPMSVRGALHCINEALDAYLTEQDGELDADSRFCIALYAQYAFNDMRFGDADVLARAKNTSVERLEAAGLVTAAKGVVRLRERHELPAFGAGDEDTLWLFTQQLAHALREGGVAACAHMVARIYGDAPDRARALAYRLHTLAEQKGWAREALAYNALVVAWPEIQQGALRARDASPSQGTLL